MIGSFFPRLNKMDERDGLSPIQRFGANLDFLIHPEFRGGDIIRQQGARNLQQMKRNRSLEELQQRADGGDKIAARYLQALNSGALDPAQAFSGYLNEFAANERFQKEMAQKLAIANASAAKKTSYRTMTGAQINELTGSNLPEGNLYNIGSDGKFSQVGGASGPSVTVQGPEKEYQKKIGGNAAEREIKIMDAGANARQTLRTIQIQENLIQDPAFQSGTGQQLFNNASQLFARLGIGEADIASAEAFQAFANKSVLDTLGGSLGTGVSNADVAFINKTVESLSNSGAGIKRLLNLRRRLAERDQLVAQEMYKWKQRTGKQMLDYEWELYISDWANQNPLFPPDESYL